MVDGYPQDATADVYPYRALTAGSKSGLLITLAQFKEDHDPLCRGSSNGFKVYLHSPNEISSVTQYYLSVPNLQNMFVALRPQLIQTSESLVDYDPKM